jgi:acetyl esterase/lipase
VALLRVTAHATGGRPVLEQRAAWSAFPPTRPPRGRTRETRFQLAGLPAIRIEPVGAVPTPATILYLHGGSFIWGSYRTYAETVARLAAAAGAPVVWVEYPLAPEHPHPAAPHAAARALAELQAADPGGRLFVAGDSSGGNLALGAALAARAGGGRPLAGCILISAWVDLAAQGGSLVDNQTIDWGVPAALELWARAYAAGADLAAPGLSPGRADPQGLCPTLVLYGEREMLRDQIEDWAQRARAAGVEVTARAFPEMIHGWFTLPAYTPQAGAAFEEIGRFIRAAPAG